MEELDLQLLGKQSIKGIVALISRTFLLQLISGIAFIIISSFLLPVDVGIYTALIAIQKIISFFTDFGLGAALIQKKEELTQGDLRTSFTIQAGITFLIFIAVVLLRSEISKFFKLNAAGEGLLLALVFTIFISSFKTIPSILLERKIEYQKLIIPQIVESLVFYILLIILVLRGFHVTSYTYAFLASSISGLPFYYYISPWKIGIGVDKKSLHHLKFGAQFQTKNILATIKDDLLTAILTQFLPFTQIGYIGFAQKLAYLVYGIVDSVTKVTFSTYARIQEHTGALKKAIEKSLFYVSSMMFPILIGTFLIAPYIVHYYPNWHNKWEPALLSLVFFCISAAVSSLSGILLNVLDATGRVKKTLYLMVIWTIMTWTLTPLFIYKFGFNGVAAASTLISITILYTIYLVKKVVDFDFLKTVTVPVLCTVVMGIIVFSGARVFAKDLLSSFLVATVGGLIYVGCFYALARKELFEEIRLIFKKHE